ncbi:MAG: PilX N-terminal domain-containing pilus assembly protein [Candidatus Electrothrix sp. YB6]
MKKIHSQNNEQGFVMIAAMLILLVLTIMGIAVNRGTNTEWRIAMNERYHKETFFRADAATQLASEVLEQSIACLGFNENSAVDLEGANGMTIRVLEGSGGFWREYEQDDLAMPTDDSRQIVFPVQTDPTTGDDVTDSHPHANINIAGNTVLTPGSAITMAQGYEGTGKGIGTGGASLVYDINVQQIGQSNSVSEICIRYQHVLGSEGDCYY